jgi:hypothetical protein
VRQLPTGEADLIVRGLAKRVRMFRTRVPAAVETVAQSLILQPHLSFSAVVVCAPGAGLMAATPP